MRGLDNWGHYHIGFNRAGHGGFANKSNDTYSCIKPFIELTTYISTMDRSLQL